MQRSSLKCRILENDGCSDLSACDGYRLVKYLARAFYDEEFPPRGPSNAKGEKFENRGIAVVILDALTRLVC